MSSGQVASSGGILCSSHNSKCSLERASRLVNENESYSHLPGGTQSLTAGDAPGGNPCAPSALRVHQETGGQVVEWCVHRKIDCGIDQWAAAARERHEA